jgi:dTMP kinase
VPVAVSTQRLAGARNPDRFEQENADFFERIRNAYLARANRFPQRFRVIDSGQTIPDIHAELEDILSAI